MTSPASPSPEEASDSRSAASEPSCGAWVIYIAVALALASIAFCVCLPWLASFLGREEKKMPYKTYREELASSIKLHRQAFFTADGNRIFLGSNGLGEFLSAETGTPIARLPFTDIADIVVSRDATRAIITRLDEIALYDITDLSAPMRLREIAKPAAANIRSTTFELNDTHVLHLEDAHPVKTLQLFDARTGNPLSAAPIPIPTTSGLLLSDVAVSEGGNEVAISMGIHNSFGFTLARFDSRTGHRIGTESSYPEADRRCFLPDGKRILVWDKDTGTVQLFDVATQAPWGPLIPSPGADYQLSHDGKLLIVTPPHGSPEVWNTDPVERRGRLGAAPETSVTPQRCRDCCSFSPDDRHVLMQSSDRIQVWDPLLCKLVSEVTNAKMWLDGFVPDGSKLHDISYDFTEVTFYDTPSLKQLEDSKVVLPESSGHIRAVFNKDGTRMLTIGYGPIHCHLWALPSGKEIPLPIKPPARH